MSDRTWTLTGACRKGIETAPIVEGGPPIPMYERVPVVAVADVVPVLRAATSALDRANWQRKLLLHDKPVKDYGECSAEIEAAETKAAALLARLTEEDGNG